MKHNSNSNKTALIAFSSSLAVLVIATLVCTALFAGASNEAEAANSVVNNNVLYVGFDKEPTEEDISAALAEWDRRREAGSVATGVSEPVVEKTIYDIDKYISDDNPTGIYIPGSENHNVDLKLFLREQTEKRAYKIGKISGEYRSASVFKPYYEMYDFSANRSAYTAFVTESLFTDNELIDKTESYATSSKVTSRKASNTTEVSSEEYFDMNMGISLPKNVEKLLFRSTPRLMMQAQNGEYSIKDYGTYLGRKAFRVTGMNYPDKDGGYYVEKTGAYTYEYIFDIETNCTLATIFYGADGEITFYAVLTELSTSNDIVVPELVK